MHLCLIVYDRLSNINLGSMPKLRLKLEWPEQSHVPLAQRDAYNEDIESQPKKKDPAESGDNDEAEPLLSSS